MVTICKEKIFRSYTRITHDVIGPSLEENNAFTNPFNCAYNSSEWNKIVKSDKLVLSHMVGHNLSLLIENRRINEELQKEYLDYLSTLSEAEQEIQDWESRNL